MYNFKGLIPKHIISDEAVGSLVRKTDEFRKITLNSSEITAFLLKIYQIYLQQLPRLMSLLEETEQEKGTSYYNIFRQTYTQLYNQYHNFIVDFLQNPSTQISTQNSIKYINFSNDLLAFQQLVKNYVNSEINMIQMAKKYFKSQKSLLNSIQAYKQSFTQAKLIYNIDEKIKRYTACENYYKAVTQERGNIIEMKEKLEERKKEIIKTFERLNKQMATYENEIDVKTFRFLSNFIVNFCEHMRKRLEITKSANKKLQKPNIRKFFQTFNIEEQEEMQREKQGSNLNRRKAAELNILIKGQVNKEEISKLYVRLEKFIERKKLQHLKIYEFHVEFYKTAEKKCMGQLKQTLATFQKGKNKLKEQFMKPCYDQLKNALKIIKITMEIYADAQKKTGSKIESAGQYIQEFKTILKNLLQDVGAYTQKTIQQMKEKESMDYQTYKQKISYIHGLIKVADEKLMRDFVHLKPIYNEILHFYDLGLVQAYDRCKDMGKISKDNAQKLENQIKQQKIQRLKNTPFYDLLSEENKIGITFDDDGEKNADFKKLKKPVEIEVVDKEKQKDGVSSTKDEVEKQKEKQECMNDAEQKQEESPLKIKKKHLEFIQSKVNFVEGEQLLKTFSCALADKIILQGRLYVTSHRICFFSNFNTSTVFFGGTFIQIPIKDIKNLEKRKNGIFFDNSISLTTINGELFFTSFFKRNQALALISRLIGLNKQDEAYEPEGALESDNSSVVEKSEKSEKNQHIIDREKEPQISESKILDDDIKQSQIGQRLESIDKLLEEFNFNYKQTARAEFNFKGFTAYKLLELLLLDHEITIGGKKYRNFTDYFKKIILLHKDVEVTSFEPAVKEHLNPNNIKYTCPTKMRRKISSTIPTPSSGIPFMPKTAKTLQNQTLYIISKHKWILDNELENSGAPYTDCFKVYFRTICDSTPSSCKIVSKIYLNFHKNTMMKSIIQSKTFEESGVQLKKQYDEIRKYLTNLEKEKSKNILKLVPISKSQSAVQSSEKISSTTEELITNDQQKERIRELQEKIDVMQEEHAVNMKKLHRKIEIYQKVLLVIVIAYIISILAWII